MILRGGALIKFFMDLGGALIRGNKVLEFVVFFHNFLHTNRAFVCNAQAPDWTIQHSIRK